MAPLPKFRKGTTADDAAIGKRIRARRTTVGISQKEFGAALGVSYQQVQKYEAGKDRFSALRLAKIAEVLGTDIGTLLFASGQAVLLNKPTTTDVAVIAKYFAVLAPAARQAVIRVAQLLSQRRPKR